MNKEKIFADGFSFSKREGAPDFVIGKVAIKVADALTFIKSHDKNGWVNLDVKQSKGGKFYMELATWTPKMDEKKNELKSSGRIAILIKIKGDAYSREI